MLYSSLEFGPRLFVQPLTMHLSGRAADFGHNEHFEYWKAH